MVGLWGLQTMGMMGMNKETRDVRTTGVSLRVWIVLIVLCLVNVAAHLIVMPSLPAQIPTHWGADGAVDGWGPRWMASALGALPLAFLAMFYVVPRIDPKGEAYRTSGKFYQGFVIAFTLIMCAIGWLCELTVWGIVPARGVVNVAVSTAIGLLFVGIGNYLPRVKQNYTMGVKTPWALADPDNWRRTQRFGGKCFVVMGLGMVLLGLVAPLFSDSMVVVGIVVLVMGGTAAMYAYSYLVWRNAKRRSL